MQPVNETRRRGAMTFELIVSAVLLASMIGALAPMAVHVSRLSQGTRQVRLALGELANQLDRLTSLPSDELEKELADLAPTEQVRSALPEAVLAGELIRDESGTQLKLTIDWQRPGNARPLALIGWVDARGQADRDAPEESPENPQKNSSEPKDASL
jgi:hypothetical protein